MAKKRRPAPKGFANSGDLTSALERDLQNTITQDLNDLVAATVADLSVQSVSPVLTGFFASSWKASSSPVRPVEKRENFPKWAGIKYTHTKKPRLLPGFSPLIEPRHPVRNTFRLNQSVFIGNTAKYTPYALVSPKAKIISFLQGDNGLNAMINTFMSDKKTDIRVGDLPNTFTKYPT